MRQRATPWGPHHEIMTCTITINNAKSLVNYQNETNMTDQPLFDARAADTYDEGMIRRVPGYALAQHLAGAVLASTLPDQANILVVGAGTGSEILHLAAVKPGWRFTALDISRHMLEVAAQRLTSAGLVDRVTFVCAPMQSAPPLPRHDACLIQLVGQFIAHEDKPAFYAAVAHALGSDAPLLSLDYRPELSPRRDALRHWALQAGASPDMVMMMESRMTMEWHIPSEVDLDAIWRAAGLLPQGRFLQALAYVGTVLRRQE